MGRVTLALIACFWLVSCQTQSTRASVEPRATPSGAVRESGPLLSYADTVDRVAPAVVTIRSSKRVRAPQQFPFSDDPFFRQFFGGGTPRARSNSQIEHALGSGVIVRNDGYIITNH